MSRLHAALILFDRRPLSHFEQVIEAESKSPKSPKSPKTSTISECRPAVKAFEDEISFAAGFYVQPRLRSRTDNPQHGFEESAATTSGSETDFGAAIQHKQNFLPLFAGQLNIHRKERLS